MTLIEKSLNIVNNTHHSEQEMDSCMWCTHGFDLLEELIEDTLTEEHPLSREIAQGVHRVTLRLLVAGVASAPFIPALLFGFMSGCQYMQLKTVEDILTKEV